MISQAILEDIRQLLAEGRSQREVAKRAHVSRSTVASIALGRRQDNAPRGVDEQIGPRGRCPKCGGLVYLPCKLCGVRKLAKAQHIRALARVRRHAPRGVA